MAICHRAFLFANKTMDMSMMNADNKTVEQLRDAISKGVNLGINEFLFLFGIVFLLVGASLLWSAPAAFVIVGTLLTGYAMTASLFDDLLSVFRPTKDVK